MRKKKVLQAEHGAPISAESVSEKMADIKSCIKESHHRRFAALTERIEKEPATRAELPGTIRPYQ